MLLNTFLLSKMNKRIAILTGGSIHKSAKDSFNQVTRTIYYNQSPIWIKHGTLKILIELINSFYLCFKIPKHDIYLLNSPSSMFLGYLKKTLRHENCKLILRLNDARFESNSFLKKIFYKPLAKKLDGAFIISKMLKKNLKMYNNKIPIDYLYTPVLNPNYFKNKPNFKAKSILSLGIKTRLGKGTDISAKIASKTQYEVYILGDIWKAQKIYNKYNHLKNLHFTGFKPPINYMAKSLFLLFPSRFDAGGTSVIEAMAAGLIPIVSHKTGNKDLVEELDPTLIINSFDYNAYLNKINDLQKLSKKELVKLSNKSKIIAKKYHNTKSTSTFSTKFKKMIKKTDLNLASFNNSTKIYDLEHLMPKEKMIMGKYFKKNKVLDIGCGCGRTTINLHKKGFKVIGIDYAPNLIKKAKEKFPNIDFRIMNASNLKFKNKTFDTIFFSYNGIDYLAPYEKRIRCMKESFRVLKNGGVFIYSSHKRFYLKSPIYTKYPFIRIHYIKSMINSIFTFNNYRYEKHQFGGLKTYCKNNSLDEPKKVGFSKIIKISNKGTNYYICYKK